MSEEIDIKNPIRKTEIPTETIIMELQKRINQGMTLLDTQRDLYLQIANLCGMLAQRVSQPQNRQQRRAEERKEQKKKKQ